MCSVATQPAPARTTKSERVNTAPEPELGGLTWARLSDSRSVIINLPVETRTPECTTHSRPGRLRHCQWAVSTFRPRMNTPVITTSRELVTRRQAPGTRSTVTGRSIRSASRGQARMLDKSASPPRTWAARPPRQVGGRSPRTTLSLDRTPSVPGGDFKNPLSRLFQVGLTHSCRSHYVESVGFPDKWDYRFSHFIMPRDTYLRYFEDMMLSVTFIFY